MIIISTHNKRSTLLLISLSQQPHLLQYLDSGIHIDINGNFIFSDSSQRSMNGRTPNFNRNSRVELSDCSFKGSQSKMFIREDTKMRGRLSGDTETDTGGGGLFVWTEPGVALGLLGGSEC